MLAGFRRQHAALGRPRVVLACSSCYQVFKRNLLDVDIISLWTLMAEQGVPAGAVPGAGRTVSIHDACTTRYEAQLQDSIRSLLRQLDYRVEELPRSRARTPCCGYGGGSGWPILKSPRKSWRAARRKARPTT